MIKTLILALFLVVSQAKADMISEFGGGLKGQMSETLEPSCEYALTFDNLGHYRVDEQGRIKTVPCGGSQPIFIGWPVAWESANGDLRIGWFHMSHWVSGPPFNHDPEVSFNCICATYKFHWKRR